MEENLRINVKLTLKDIKEFSLAKAYSGISSKLTLVFSAVMALIIFLCILGGILSEPYDKYSRDAVLGSLFLFFIIIAINTVPFLMIYMVQRVNFTKSKLLGDLICYEFMDETINISSQNNSFSLKWKDIYKVQELKPCFLIFLAPGKYFMIPRRCFNGKEQLDSFLIILTSKVSRSKFKLKKYKMGRISPDYGEVTTSTESVQPIKSKDILPISEVEFSLNRSEILNINFTLYYTKPVSIIITIVGALFLFISFRGYVPNYNFKLLTLTLGIFFTVMTPIFIYFSTNKQFEKDTAFKESYSYKFYSDYFTVSHPSGKHEVKWSDLVKVKELKSAFLLFSTTQLGNIIPKRAFEGKKEELEELRKLISEKFPK